MDVNSNRFLRDCPLFQPDRREQNFIKLFFWCNRGRRRGGGEGGQGGEEIGIGKRKGLNYLYLTKY
jgi:hypothetical protein